MFSLLKNFGDSEFLCTFAPANRLQPPKKGIDFVDSAPVAELVDALDLGSSISRCAGSSPVRRTTKRSAYHLDMVGVLGSSPSVDTKQISKSLKINNLEIFLFLFWRHFGVIIDFWRSLDLFLKFAISGFTNGGIIRTSAFYIPYS